MHPGPGAGDEHGENEEDDNNDRNDGGFAHWLRSALHSMDSTTWDDEAAERPGATALDGWGV
jgi:hypothetical protein